MKQKASNLPTYLVAKGNKGGDGFANIAQSMSGLYAEAMALTNNVMACGVPTSIGCVVPTSIGFEETFSNVNVAADCLSKMADIAYELYGYEVLHTTQAMNMRMQDGKKVGEGTTKFLNAYRKTVSFVTKDRIYTNDIKFLRTLDPATLK